METSQDIKTAIIMDIKGFTKSAGKAIRTYQALSKGVEGFQRAISTSATQIEVYKNSMETLSGKSNARKIQEVDTWYKRS